MDSKSQKYEFTLKEDRIIQIITWVAGLSILTGFIPLFIDFTLPAVIIALFTLIALCFYFLMSFCDKVYLEDNILTAVIGFLKIKIDLKKVVLVTDKYSLFTTAATIKIARSRELLTLRYYKENSNLLTWISIGIVEEELLIKKILEFAPDCEFKLNRLSINSSN